MKISVIGAGIGGLSTACLLAAKGHSVTVFEKNEGPGGKMNVVCSDGFRFDTGPSLLTMPFILERLFDACGSNLSEQLELIPLKPLCRYFYADGTVFDNYHDLKATQQELQKLAPDDVESYTKFLNYSRSLYQKTARNFIFNPLYDLNDLKDTKWRQLLSIDAFTTVSKRVARSFTSPHLRQFFNRFATYNGSSPFLAPATLNVIPHVEINLGGYYVKGGMYRIAKSLHELAESLGVRFHFNAEVEQIICENNTVTGIQLSSRKRVQSDLIICNSDASESIRVLLANAPLSSKKKRKALKAEPSCSGFVMLLGIDTQFEQLRHHNIFFSNDGEREFKQIFKEKSLPEQPTIYVSNTSQSDPGHAPKGGSNLFILINAPYLTNKVEWSEVAKSYGDSVISHLEARGLINLSKHIKFRKTITPQDFYDQYASFKGSIYGTSSNSKMSAFVRPRNKSRDLEGLYFVGGSTHPGGGIPLVVQSAFNALELIERYEGV